MNLIYDRPPWCIREQNELTSEWIPQRYAPKNWYKKLYSKWLMKKSKKVRKKIENFHCNGEKSYFLVVRVKSLLFNLCEMLYASCVTCVKYEQLIFMC